MSNKDFTTQDQSSTILGSTSLNDKSLEKDKLIVAYKAAKYLGISLPTFRNMVVSGQVKYYILNKRKKFKRSDLDKLVL